ncbi:MAG: outer membrane beta-barrel protein [Pseudomonadota bacterium]
MARHLLRSSVCAAAMLAIGIPTVAKAADEVLPSASADERVWVGPYFGVSLGLGLLDSDGDLADSSSYIDLGALDTIGVLGGVQLGWNFQRGDVLFGLEGDVSLVDLGGRLPSADDVPSNSTRTDDFLLNTDYFATLRGRIGFVDDDVLVYGTFGAAFIGGDIYDFGSEEGRNVATVAPVIGAGIEWGVSRNLSLRMEGLYTSFNYGIDLSDFSIADSDSNYTPEGIVMARIGLNYRFDGTAASFSLDADSDAHDWSGIYFGGLVGAGALDTSGFFDGDDSTSLLFLGALGGDGIIAGGQVGYNYQRNRLVLGVEADISAIDWGGQAREGDVPSERVRLNTDYLATLRGRVGYADGDLLIYGTAGAAFLSGNLVNAGADLPNDFNVDAWGFVAGAGMEWAASENLSVKVESLYVGFNDFTDLSNVSDAIDGDGLTLDGSIIARVGVNWKFR